MMNVSAPPWSRDKSDNGILRLSVDDLPVAPHVWGGRLHDESALLPERGYTS